LIHLDIGGEGRYPAAINLNPAREGADGPVPRLVVGVGQQAPIRSRSIDLVTAENIPIHGRGVLDEIARVIRARGAVELVNPDDYEPIRRAHLNCISMLNGRARQYRDANGWLHTRIEDIQT
jgi:hypothetical protein